mgnify:CR=1 FL=1
MLALLGLVVLGDFVAPLPPPRAEYRIQLKIDFDKNLISGQQTVRMKNTARHALGQIAVSWTVPVLLGTLQCEFEGRKLTAVNQKSPLVFELPREWKPGESIELRMNFSMLPTRPREGRPATLVSWHPKVWWGSWGHDDYVVRIEAPPDLKISTSGRWNPKTKAWEARDVRLFGLILSAGLKVIEGESAGVAIRALHTEKGAPCAKFLMDAAKDIIAYYSGRFGFYPHRVLTILPGADQPMGGYPVATGIVVVHGQETFETGKRDQAWWRWIMAHEIGHQYWSEHVVSAEEDSLGWLMIGLGIYADREYCRARGMSEHHKRWIAQNAGAVRRGVDTTVDRTPEMVRNLKFDWNNTVVHDKGLAIISALQVAIGRDTFNRAYMKAFAEYKGRPLHWMDFRHFCERESGQNLGWFFEQWVRSNRFLSYGITGKESRPQGSEFVARVLVEKTGSLSMPVPVEVTFDDGSRQRAITNRLLDKQEIVFHAKAALKEAVIDPDGELPNVYPPPDLAEREWSTRISALPYSGAGAAALEVYQLALKRDSKEAETWIKLGLSLYDGAYHAEALDAFVRLQSATADPTLRFTSLVWQGHLLDLAGRRADAIAKYRAALAIEGNPTMRHDQYGMVINKKWVEERLETPFKR